MKIFIFSRIADCTNNYHSEGGVVIIAKDKEEAMSIIDSTEATIREEDWEKVVTYELKNEQEPDVFIFPDAGCC